jgi:hypothetical protein
MHVIHVYVGLYYSVLLGRRFLGLGLGSSVLFAGLYILSYQAGTYIAFTPFFFQLTLVPLLAYTLCHLLYARRWTSAVVGSMVVLLYMLTSYGPTMAAGFGAAALLCLHVLYQELQPQFELRDAWRRLALPGLAIGLALLIAVPFYLGQGSFFAHASGSPKSLSFIAHGDTFNGRDLFAALSSSVLGASQVEGRMYFGLVPVLVLVIGLSLIALNISQVPRRMIATLAWCGHHRLGHILLHRADARTDASLPALPDVRAAVPVPRGGGNGGLYRQRRDGAPARVDSGGRCAALVRCVVLACCIGDAAEVHHRQPADGGNVPGLHRHGCAGAWPHTVCRGHDRVAGPDLDA